MKICEKKKFESDTYRMISEALKKNLMKSLNLHKKKKSIVNKSVVSTRPLQEHKMQAHVNKYIL